MIGTDVRLAGEVIFFFKEGELILDLERFQPNLAGVEQETEEHQEQHGAHHVSLHVESPPHACNLPQHFL